MKRLTHPNIVYVMVAALLHVLLATSIHADAGPEDSLRFVVAKPTSKVRQPLHFGPEDSLRFVVAKPTSKVRQPLHFGFHGGKPNSDDAAGFSPAPPADLRGWSYGYALGDTTGYDFPDTEEEKSTGQLVREVTMWVVLAGAVAFFIVRVFFDRDEEEVTKPPPAKPDPTFVSPAPPARSPL